ncbi:2-hydroxyhepta-2,4-diene-1,7-dioate isomerase [Pseudoflavitalea sp. X16]|uniref:fumarylacetoacetate hydrolase family protein n=1 Tax=Paraflavitalea devenefica TaxID=2716334 RepID=UPI00141DB01C|nr:fumarylacetoacetate hydrolase family protein [Paraflavitalea devenefica]NII26430.1 2-hydroxyhepta-2,4-diene-1,7-dioate isomerase [Paraflavitalea devenefica]
MKLYKTKKGAVIEKDGHYYALNESWEALVNDDQLYEKLDQLTYTSTMADSSAIQELLPPVGRDQELWACGVTYLRSKIGRQEESKAAGGADFYAKVYEAERPEVFFKSTYHRIVGHGGLVRIRKDSTWDVPEPELTLVVTPSGKIVGYTIGNDMSSRSIEGENPLYLPQAKTYDGSAAVGPCIYVTREPLPANTAISLVIARNNTTAYKGEVSISQLKRTPEELVSFVYRECSFPYGCLIMTGTGIVPGHDFTLQSGDEIAISIDPIGTLENTVQ